MGEFLRTWGFTFLFGSLGAFVMLWGWDAVRAIRRLRRKASNRGRITKAVVQIGDHFYDLPGGLETLKLHEDGTPLGMKKGDPPDPDNLAAIGAYMRWAEQMLRNEYDATREAKAREQSAAAADDTIVT